MAATRCFSSTSLLPALPVSNAIGQVALWRLSGQVAATGIGSLAGATRNADEIVGLLCGGTHVTRSGDIGPFLPEGQWLSLQQSVRRLTGVSLLRQVPDMVAEMRNARASLSQCGYNTALDIVVARVPALVVPYATATENEQGVRAARLAQRGALRWADVRALVDPARLVDEIDALLRFVPRSTALDLDGAANSARHLHQLAVEGFA